MHNGNSPISLRHICLNIRLESFAKFLKDNKMKSVICFDFVDSPLIRYSKK